jgi:four helix bundle protein
MNLSVIIYELTKQLPREEEYGLKSQIKRATVSMTSCIAEGCSRSSQREFKHYLEISLGSSFEVETDLILSERLGMLPKEGVENALLELHLVQKKINSFISKVKALC